MSLILHYHPLSSFCHKVLVALYENEVPFVPQQVDLRDAVQCAAFRQLWPIGKFPVLRDEARARTVPESTIIIEYLQEYFPGQLKLIPDLPELALETRRLDRLLDLYVHVPMQRVVGDRLRPESVRDPHGVEEARATMRTALGLLESDLAGQTWANGDQFLFYASKIMSLADPYPVVAAYLHRLMQRPSHARVLVEAEPYFHLFPA